MYQSASSRNRGFYISIIFIVIIIIACEWPFDTEPTVQEELFILTAEHSITRVFDEEYIQLSWNEITVEEFRELRIERRGGLDTGWTLITITENPFLTAYTDTIVDDDDIEYRVGISSGDFILWAYRTVIIPKTTAVMVPGEFNSIQSAIESQLMDDDDSIMLAPDEYYESIRIVDKAVRIISETGPDSTSIIAEPSTGFAVHMNSGYLIGCTIENSGGGIYLRGNGKIYNCVIRNNGGGIASGIYILSASGNVINNTIVNNYVTIDGRCDSLLFYNNIIYGNGSDDIKFFSTAEIDSQRIDYSLLNIINKVGSNNLAGNPDFFITNWGAYHLQLTSQCINSGHPGAAYFNLDGTRNTLGAYGGPYAVFYSNTTAGE